MVSPVSSFCWRPLLIFSYVLITAGGTGLTLRFGWQMNGRAYPVAVENKPAWKKQRGVPTALANRMLLES